MSAKTKFLLTLLVLIVWVAGSGMSELYSPQVLARPQVTVTNVVRNKTVQISLQNFQADVVVEVLIGAYGTHGVNGVKVGTFKTTLSGTLKATVSIPSQFRGANRLDLRVQRRGYNGTGNLNYFAYITFNNKTPTPVPPQKSISIQVVKVVHNKSVTVRFGRLPTNMRFEVRMAGFGGKQGGYQTVGSFNSGSGDTLVATYPIPRALAGSKLLILVVHSTTQGYSGMTLFFN
jgi:hypothetical protein